MTETRLVTCDEPSVARTAGTVHQSVIPPSSSVTVLSSISTMSRQFSRTGPPPRVPQPRPASNYNYGYIPTHSRASYPLFVSLQDTLRIQASCAGRGLLDAFRWDIVVRLVVTYVSVLIYDGTISTHVHDLTSIVPTAIPRFARTSSNPFYSTSSPSRPSTPLTSSSFPSESATGSAVTLDGHTRPSGFSPSSASRFT